MNVTNATFLFRSDLAANYAAANTTLGNATYNAPEAAYERDTKRVKIGLGNWTTIGYLANLTDLSTLNASNLTSGTVPAARLPVANTTALGAVKAGANITIDANGTISANASGGGGNYTLPIANGSTLGGVKVGTGLAIDGSGVLSSTANGTSRGFWYDIRSYGAVVGAANAANNTAAVQAAMDAACVQSGGWGGGTVYFPATELQNDYMWDLDSPVWVHGSNIKVQGEGSQNTCVRARGPAFVVSKHPRFWNVQKATYASDGTATTGTVDGATNWINVSKCKPDLYEFRTGRAFPPTNGNPQFAPATITGTGQYFGIRTQLGVAQARFPYCPMITGDQAQSNQSADPWPVHNKLTWEFVHYNHQTSAGGAIAGGGGCRAPDPWILYMAGGNYYFELALTDKDMIDRTWVEFTFPMNDTIGIHRVCIQFDPDNADSSKRLVAYVDGVQKTVTPNNIQWFYRGNYCYLNTVNGSGGLDNLWTKYNRVARWVESEFHVCSENLKSGYYSSEQAPYLKDYTVLALAVHSVLRYQVNGAGTAQLKLSDGTAADDSYVWAHTAGNFDTGNKTTIGWMANEFSWSANANTNTNINAMCRGQGGKEIWGYMAPKGDGGEPNWGGAPAINSPAIEGLRIRQYNAYSVSCGILNGPWINTYRLNDLEFDQGYFFSIGAQWRQVSYYGRWSNLKLGKGVHLVHMTTYGDKWDWGYANFCAIRLSGCEFHLRDFSYPAPEANDEGFLQSFCGGSIGAGIYLYEGTINQEGLQFAPLIAVFYIQKNYAQGNNSLTIRDVQIGEVNAPVFYFDDYFYDDSRATHIDVARAGFGAYGPFVIAKGKDWAGSVEVGPATYLTDQVRNIPAIAGQVFCDVKTVDKTSYGLPPTGGFTKDCHEIHVRNPAGGSPAIWRVTSTGKEGSATVPTWSAIEIADSPTPGAISANIYPSIRANCVLPWTNGTNTTTLDFTSFTNQFANSTLATILTNATAPNRTTSRLKWGYLNSYTLTDSAYGAWTGTEWEGTFFAGNAVTNSGLWAASANGTKVTNVTYNTTGRDPDGTPAANWTVYGQYKWVWAMEIGDGSNSMKVAMVGRTNVQNPDAWAVTNASTPQVASGGLALTRVNRPGTWTNTTANQILDYMVGGTLSLGATWYFGLSKTTVSTLDGTGATEPSSGSYARVAVTRNATNWGELFDAQYIYANKVAIEFPAPTADWGFLTDWFISDAATLGNVIAAGKLNRPIRVLNGDPKPVFLPGAFQVQL